MAKVILRFYGRFAFIKEKSNGVLTGRIDVVAPRFTSPYDAHAAVMTIRRDKLAPSRRFTNLPPSRKAVTDAQDVVEADQFEWDLDGVMVTLEGAAASTPSATLEIDPRFHDRMVFEMSDLLRRGEVTEGFLDPAALQPSAAGKAQAVVALARGTGFARLASESDKAFLVTRAEALTGDPQEDERQGLGKTGTEHPFPLCDLVEFEYEVGVRQPFTLILTSLSGSASKVSVKADADDETIVVGFSNFCPDLPSADLYDLEFCRYFDLLTVKPADDQMMVPRHFTGDGGELEECGIELHMTYDVASKRIVE